MVSWGMENVSVDVLRRGEMRCWHAGVGLANMEAEAEGGAGDDVVGVAGDVEEELYEKRRVYHWELGRAGGVSSQSSDDGGGKRGTWTWGLHAMKRRYGRGVGSGDVRSWRQRQ